MCEFPPRLWDGGGLSRSGSLLVTELLLHPILRTSPQQCALLPFLFHHTRLLPAFSLPLAFSCPSQTGNTETHFSHHYGHGFESQFPKEPRPGYLRWEFP